jgi:hypothetical protein
MSHSYINSAFFVKDNNISYTSHNEEIMEGSYEKISEEKDIYLIHTDHKSYKLHRKKLLKSLRLLRQHGNTLIKDLDENMLDRFNGTIESIRILYNSKTLTELILNDIRNIFADIKNPIEGSVSAFFTSCFYDDSLLQLPLGCNLKCANASSHCDGFECADTIMEFNNNTFHTVHDKNTDNAYIYIKCDNFKKFYPYHIDLLKNEGIKSIVIIYNDKNISNKIYLNTLYNNNNNVQGVTVAIMVIMIIIVLIALLYMYHQGYIKI